MKKLFFVFALFLPLLAFSQEDAKSQMTIPEDMKIPKEMLVNTIEADVDFKIIDRENLTIEYMGRLYFTDLETKLLYPADAEMPGFPVMAWFCYCDPDKGGCGEAWWSFDVEGTILCVCGNYCIYSYSPCYHCTKQIIIL